MTFVSFLIPSWLDGFHQSKKPSLVSRSCSEISGCTLSSWVLPWRVQVSKATRASQHVTGFAEPCSRLITVFTTNGEKAHIWMCVMKRWITLDWLGPCRALAGGMVRGCLWDCRQVSSSDVSQWRAASLWAAVQLRPEKRHSHTGRFIIKSQFSYAERHGRKQHFRTSLLVPPSLPSRPSWANFGRPLAITWTHLLKALPSSTSWTLPCPHTYSQSTD